MANKKQNFIKRFNNHSEYNTFVQSEDFVIPNVSQCLTERDIHYNTRATGVTLDEDSITIGVGETGTLTATVLPVNAGNKNITWSTSDDTIATVVDGVVSGVAAGTATITVTTEEGGFTAACEVTVE